MKFEIIHLCEIGSSSENKIGSWYRLTSLILFMTFVEPSDYYDAPINKVLHFIQDIGLIKGYSKGEAQ
jgi:hypothetical protein